jgi:hypothetical protein
MRPTIKTPEERLASVGLETYSDCVVAAVVFVASAGWGDF